jgi:hypothetical protein
MHVLTESELRFEIRRAVQSLPKGVLRGLVGKPEPYERALRAAEEVIYQRLAGFQVRRAEVDLKRWDFGAMKNR